MEKNFQIVADALSENLKRLRAKAGIAQERLGLESGVDRTVVSKIERCVANPTLDVLVRLAKTLEVDVEDLLKKPPKRTS